MSQEQITFGLPLSSLTEILNFVPQEHAEKPSNTVVDKTGKLRPYRKYIKDHYDNFKWEENWYRLPKRIMFNAFSVDELSRIIWDSPIMSEVSEEFANNHRYQVFHKIRNGMWHWGWTDNYNVYVKHYEAIRRFDFGLKDFEVFLDYTTSYNDFGYSQHSRTYIDGTFCYIVTYKGKHVLTIGFSVTYEGVYIQQIQLKDPKGNRWLYKLPMNYFEYVVFRMFEVFGDVGVWLVDGNTLADRISRSYLPETDPLIRLALSEGREVKRFTPEKRAHVMKIYDQYLNGFQREESTESRRTIFYRLRQKQPA